MLDALAMAYALDLLGARARRRFEAMLRDQPATAVRVAGWQARLAQMQGSVPCAAVPPALRNRLERRLFGAPLPEAPRPAAAPAQRGRRALAAWWPPAFGMAMGATLAVALLAWRPATLGLERGGDALPASYIGVLADAEGRGGLIVSSRRHGRVVNLKLVAPIGSLPPRRVARLWAYPGDGAAPFLVGPVPLAGKATLRLQAPSEQLFAQVTRLAVHGDLPGEVTPGMLLLSGPCAKLW